MNTLIVCLLITLLLPYLAKIPLGYAMQKEGAYDNHYPREQQARLEGFGSRAFAAHQNSFEALALFSTAALTALATHHVSSTIQNLAIVFIASRVIYHSCYLLDLSILRSSFWFVGFASCVAIMGLCLP